MPACGPEAAGDTFQWPELVEAEAELEVRDAVSTYPRRSKNDVDQVRA
jgi:hypothetical protein